MLELVFLVGVQVAVVGFVLRGLEDLDAGPRAAVAGRAAGRPFFPC